MTDPRPQYGEYATPEEQRRRAGLPPVDAPSIPPAAAPPSRIPDLDPQKPVRPVDRIATVALLAYGLVNVIINGLSYVNLPDLLNSSMKILGIEGEFSNFAQGKIWGTVAAIVLALGWVVTAIFSVRRLRRGKLSWWVPLVGAVVTMILVSICIMVPMFGDAAFMQYLAGFSGS